LQSDFYLSLTQFQNGGVGHSVGIKAGIGSRIITNDNVYNLVFPVMSDYPKAAEHFEMSENDLVYPFDTYSTDGDTQIIVDKIPKNLNGKTVKIDMKDKDNYTSAVVIQKFQKWQN